MHGEAIIEAGDREVRVYYNNRALAQAETAMGKSIVAVANGFTAGELGITETAQLLRAGMEAARRDARAGGHPVRMEDAYEVMDDAGFPTVLTAVMEAVAAVLGYSSDEDGDPDPNE